MDCRHGNGREIGHEIKTLSHEIDRYILCHSSNDGVTRMHGWLIGYLYNEAGERDIYQKDIETRFNIRRSTATGILKLMEKNGLIVRTEAKHDARLKKISLTPKAEQIHSRICSGIESIERRLTDGLSADEVDAFFAITAKMRENLKNSSNEMKGETHYDKKADPMHR